MTDVVVIIPKRDELEGVQVAFRVDLDAGPDERFESGVELYRNIRVGSTEVTLALLTKQTNTHSGILTLEIIHRENPLQIYLVGTALGNPRQASVGSVFVSTGITDISERRPSMADPYGYSPSGPWSHAPLTSAAERFIGRRYTSQANRSKFFEEVSLPPYMHDVKYEKTIASLTSAPNKPTIANELILSGNEYIMFPEPVDESFAEGTDDGASVGLNSANGVAINAATVWDRYAQYRAYDMEAAGFSLAAQSAGVPWLVFRTTSDHGSTETRADRRVSAMSAGKLLYEFLESGMNDLATIRASRPKFAGVGMPVIRGAYRGFMGYHDDEGEIVVYEDGCDFEYRGNVVVANIRSSLLTGVGTESLRYQVDFTLAKDGYVAGTWAQGDDSGPYFGSISGLYDYDTNEFAGVWTGTHGQGIRVGRFRWYNTDVAAVSTRFATEQSRQSLQNQFVTELESSDSQLNSEVAK